MARKYPIIKSGDVYANWIVIADTGSKTPTGARKLLCKCKCGTEKQVDEIGLNRGTSTSCGKGTCRKDFIDIKGKKFGRWTVVDISKKENGNYFWNVICDCGKKSVRKYNNLKYSNSCGCISVEMLVARCKLPEGVAAQNLVLISYKKWAKNRGHSFNLTDEECLNLMVKNCFYCGALPSNGKKSRTSTFIYSGIDRVDNSLGYQTDNCVPCCKKCNTKKFAVSMLMAEKMIEFKNLYSGS